DPEDKPAAKGQHDLSALRVFTKVILYVKDNYVDPKRVKPKEMMVSALEYVEKTVPDVMVDGSAESGVMKLNVNGKLKQFDISHVDSLWKMSFTLKDVFEFIAKNMRPVEDTREIEYAAVNGMLQTLDPHSVLLRPELYREMKLTTKGEFGGLGFVIQMKEGNLTVVKVLPKTPAFRAGIKKDDQIKKIGDESTVNMDLNEAVSKLRGPVDSKVTITIERKAWERPTPMTLTRAMINIESVQSKLLSQNVGYVRLKNFQGNTTRHLQQALGELDASAREKGSPGGIRGLVLDMRGNPGGLLDQAIQVSDLFVSQGTIVATVGFSDKLREEKKAHADEGDDVYPIAVLLNAGSASASEIVAGALKNLNRAVIIGRQSFGKGSVQVLYDFPDDSALKLTIAKYLTPGDVSIQEVGITPDIELIPTRVTKDRLDVFAPRKTLGEADLEHHFSNSSKAEAVKKREDLILREKPSESLKYLKDEPKEKVAEAAKPPSPAHPKDPKLKGKDKPTDPPEVPATAAEELDDQLDAESQDEVKEDFEVSFARDFVIAAPFVRRDKMLEAGKGFITEKRQMEEARIATAITALGIDWTPGETPKNVQLTGTIKPGIDRKIAAGETVQVEVTAENRGTEPLRRVRAWTESDNGFLDKREFLFGMLKPGEKKSWSVQVKLPKDLTSRRDGVTLKFQDDSGLLPETVLGELSFTELPRPAFSFNYQVIDDCAACNGDGNIQRGEEITLLLDVTNTGTGKALDTFTSIKNASDQNVFIEKGRFKLGELAPGETKTAKFNLQVKKAYVGTEFGLRMAIIDEPLEEFTADKLSIPIEAEGSPAVAFEARKGTVKLNEKAELLASADANARVLARLPRGALVNELARGSAVSRVEWEKDRFAFVRLADLRDAKGTKATPVKEPTFIAMRNPPDISLSVDPSQGGVVADTDRFTLSGVVTDPALLDVYVLVNDQKVYFRSRESGDDPRLKFTTDFALREGNNLVTVVARESQDFASRKTVVIRRRPAAVAQKVSPTAPLKAKP
ncbi:MAG: carboxyl-terminal protease, partial [Myxococcaceae bacterium]|nr:carboxyl-terminal protease [Myxococcaceae bacterium]